MKSFWAYLFIFTLISLIWTTNFFDGVKIIANIIGLFVCFLLLVRNTNFMTNETLKQTITISYLFTTVFILIDIFFLLGA